MVSMRVAHDKRMAAFLHLMVPFTRTNSEAA